MIKQHETKDHETKDHETKEHETKEHKTSGCKKVCIGCVVFIGGVIIAFIIFFVLSYVKYPYKNAIDHRAEYDSLFFNNREHVYHMLQQNDSCYMYDSIISEIAANQITIIKRQDDLINDIRQETSNNIDKANSLLTFWVGIMGLLGVFVPIILQLRIYFDDKQLKDTFKNEIDEHLKRASKKYREHCQFMDENQARLDCQLCVNELNSFSIVAKYGCTQEYSDGSNVLILLWKQSTNNLENMIKFYFKEGSSECEKYRTELISALIHVWVTLNLFNEHDRIKPRYRSRDIVRIKDNIQQRITDIASRNYVDWSTLHGQMKDTIRILRNLKFDKSS